MNRLAAATSPYLLQHRDNPVHWWTWGPEAFAEAERRDRPVLLSVGYSACHWCHVMAHESFEDEATAAVMNALFVNIKVDREERPDVDHIYMSALHALGEQGGWPLTMFLTPRGEPFWGGTYFPPTPRYGKPGFPTLLREVERIYRQEPGRIRHNAEAIRRHLTARAAPAAGPTPSLADLDRLAEKLAGAYDPIHGGLQGAPKFPNPPLLEFLWRATDRTADPAIRAPFLTTLRRMAEGGIHDHLGGGFARYSVDAEWLVPHFEKMLYDNGQLLELYALAFHSSPESIFREAAEGIHAWLVGSMVAPGGGFASAYDADSEGEEGRFYVWDEAELRALAGPDSDLLETLFDLPPGGNWEGRIILRRQPNRQVAASDQPRYDALRRRLLAHRAKRVPPGWDDKVLADWNGIAIAALVRATPTFSRPDFLETARRAYRFVIESMRPEGRLMHAWRAGSFSGPAMALDHAAMARAALALHEATCEATYLADAQAFAGELERRFVDPETGRLAMTAADTSDLILRPDPTHDDAVPNANGVYAEVLVRLAQVTGDIVWLSRADRLFASIGADLLRLGLAHASLLNALDLRLRGATIAVAGGDPPLRQSLADAAFALPYAARTVVQVTGAADLPAAHPAGAQVAAAGRGAAFVCLGERCSLPVRDPSGLADAVSAFRAGGPVG